MAGRGPGGAPVLLGSEPPADALATADARALDRLLMANAPVETNGSTARPALAEVEDITYDLATGAVEIRYHTVNDIVLRGQPDDPRIQRLLQAALLDDGNPAARLHAAKAVEEARPAPEADLVRALTYLAQTEPNADMRFRAVRALRALYRGQAPTGPARDALVNVLLDGPTTALRTEALRALTAHLAADAAPDADLARILRGVAGRDSSGAMGPQARRALGSAADYPADRDALPPLDVR